MPMTILLPLTVLWVVLSVSLSYNQSENTPTAMSDNAYSILKELNSWDRLELEIAELSQHHPGRKPSGETNGWIAAHQNELYKLGYKAEWDQKRKSYILRHLSGKQTESSRRAQ